MSPEKLFSGGGNGVDDERKAVTREISERYRKAKKKDKGLILDEFTALTGYNRSYASYLVSSQ